MSELQQVPVRRALLSVYDKTGLEDLARGLHAAGVALVSTGSTAARIAAVGVPGRHQREACDETRSARATWESMRKTRRCEMPSTTNMPSRIPPLTSASCPWLSIA